MIYIKNSIFEENWFSLGLKYPLASAVSAERPNFSFKLLCSLTSYLLDQMNLLASEAPNFLKENKAIEDSEK